MHETQVGILGSSLAYFSELRRVLVRRFAAHRADELFLLDTPFVPGHVTSNEPAYYETGSYGIRLESVLGVREVSTRRDFGDKKWLGFERFTTVSGCIPLLAHQIVKC